jgi:hypothetical protein
MEGVGKIIQEFAKVFSVGYSHVGENKERFVANN